MIYLSCLTCMTCQFFLTYLTCLFFISCLPRLTYLSWLTTLIRPYFTWTYWEVHLKCRLCTFVCLLIFSFCSHAVDNIFSNFDFFISLSFSQKSFTSLLEYQNYTLFSFARFKWNKINSYTVVNV